MEDRHVEALCGGQERLVMLDVLEQRVYLIAAVLRAHRTALLTLRPGRIEAAGDIRRIGARCEDARKPEQL